MSEQLNTGHRMYLEVQLEALEEDLDDTIGDYSAGLIDSQTARDKIMELTGKIADIKIELKQ
jgi:hypothetical protein